MKWFSLLFLVAVAALCLTVTAPKAYADVGVSIGIAPDCPYGYYAYSPYSCAPYGYYGPEWFENGVFIGVGPWYHGPEHFRGHVDRHYDMRYGYHGERPHRGEHADWGNRHFENFHGTDVHDGHGRVMHEHGGMHDHGEMH